MGLMGSRMARNLAQKGFGVTVWNRTRERAQPLTAFGATVADTPAQLAANSDVLCTCVTDPAALREVAFGKDGLLSAARPGSLFIDFSTVSVELAREVEARCRAQGLDFVDAPVTGSRNGAETGTLVLMVGASEAAFARCQPVFNAVGSKAILCGPVGAGTQVKLAGNALIALMLEGLSEGMLLTQRAGVDPRRFLEVVQASGFRSPYYDFKGKALLERDFQTHFAIDHMFKDLNLFLENAGKHRIPTPAVNAVRESYQLARAQGKGGQDITAVITALEDLSGQRLS